MPRLIDIQFLRTWFVCPDKTPCESLSRLGMFQAEFLDQASANLLSRAYFYYIKSTHLDSRRSNPFGLEHKLGKPWMQISFSQNYSGKTLRSSVNPLLLPANYFQRTYQDLCFGNYRTMRSLCCISEV